MTTPPTPTPGAADALSAVITRIDHVGVAVRDLDAAKEFWRKYETRLDSVGSAVNNAYLKANGVKGGVQSYAQSAQLLLDFAHRNNGTCVVDLTKNMPDQQKYPKRPATSSHNKQGRAALPRGLKDSAMRQFNKVGPRSRAA